MGEGTSGSFHKTILMGLEYFFGLMEESIKATGRQVYSKEKVNIIIHRGKL